MGPSTTTYGGRQVTPRMTDAEWQYRRTLAENERLRKRNGALLEVILEECPHRFDCNKGEIVEGKK